MGQGKGILKWDFIEACIFAIIKGIQYTKTHGRTSPFQIKFPLKGGHESCGIEQ